MTRSHGLTLIEVVISVAVLAIGVLVAFQLQATALRYTARAESMNLVTRVARAEIELQRHTASLIDITGTEVDDGTTPAPVDSVTRGCETFLPGGIQSCSVLVEPCGIAAGAGGLFLSCGSNVLAPPAYRISVSVVGARGQELTLSSIATGIYIAGTQAEEEEGEP